MDMSSIEMRDFIREQSDELEKAIKSILWLGVRELEFTRGFSEWTIEETRKRFFAKGWKIETQVVPGPTIESGGETMSIQARRMTFTPYPIAIKITKIQALMEARKREDPCWHLQCKDVEGMAFLDRQREKMMEKLRADPNWEPPDRWDADI